MNIPLNFGHVGSGSITHHRFIGFNGWFSMGCNKGCTHRICHCFGYGTFLLQSRFVFSSY
jgi:hypothetical protein